MKNINPQKYLEENPPSEFEKIPFHISTGNFITYISKDCTYYAKQIDNLLTAYYSIKDDQLIGFKLLMLEKENNL